MAQRRIVFEPDDCAVQTAEFIVNGEYAGGLWLVGKQSNGPWMVLTEDEVRSGLGPTPSGFTQRESTSTPTVSGVVYFTNDG